MILIDEVLVEDRISSNYFECDLKRCKGACCTFPGEHGAPLLDEEIAILKEVLPSAMDYLSEKSIKYIENHGFIQGSSGEYTTMCIDKKDCVFVFYEGDIALCAIEKANRDGKISFKKPISCHLFPIRVGNFNGKYLYYEKISQCSSAISKGFDTNTKIYESVKDALIRSFGEEWYQNYLEEIGKANK